MPRHCRILASPPVGSPPRLDPAGVLQRRQAAGRFWKAVQAAEDAYVEACEPIEKAYREALAEAANAYAEELSSR